MITRPAPPETASFAATGAEPRGGVHATRRYVAGQLALLALLAALVPLRDLWPARVVLLAAVLVVPGLLLLRALRLPGRALAAFPVYVPCASLAVVTGTALGIDLLGPAVLGLDRPLRPVPVGLSLAAVCLALLPLAALAPRAAALPWRAFGLRIRDAWPLALPLVSGAGALVLTHGHGGGVALVGLVLAALTLAAAVALAPRLSRGQVSFLLFGAGLAAIWAISLRGRYVYGFDISAEHFIAVATWHAGVWHPNTAGDAYRAMLSLTVLPSALHALTGTSIGTLMKGVYPVLFALFPVALFHLATRFVTRRWAVLPAAVLVAQPYFFAQLPAVARQEIAMLFFVALVAVVLDRELPRLPRAALITLTGLGLVVSHYSTAYLTISLLVPALVLALLLRLVRRPSAATAAVALALVATGAGAGVWYGAVTHSTQNLGQLGSALQARGFDLLPNAKPGSNPLEAYTQGNQSVREPAREYEAAAVRQARAQQYVHPLKAAAEPRYRLRDAPAPNREPSRPGIDALLNLSRLGVAQIVNLLALLGAALLVLRRRTAPLARMLGLLAVGTLGVSIFVRLSGTAAAAYNQERAWVQTIVPLGIAGACLLQDTVGRLRGRVRAGLVGGIAALGVLASFVGATGLGTVATGASRPTALANGGEDYERFYVTSPEMAAAGWLSAAPEGALTYADRYGSLRILGATGRSHGLLKNVTPRTLDRHAWVYASRTNVQGTARGEIGSRYAVYRWPSRFLDAHFDTVFDAGGSRVYHR